MNIPKLLRRSFWTPIIRDWHWRRIAPMCRLPSGVNVPLLAECDWITFCDLFVNGEYDQAVMECLSDYGPSSKMQVVDLGGNIGFFYLRFLHLYRSYGSDSRVTYTAVEPNPVCADQFMRNVKTNTEGKVCFSLLRGLVGARSGTGSFEASQFHIGSRVTACPSKRAQKIPYINLLEELSDGPISLMKIDIEGSEEAFLGEFPEILTRVDHLIIEIHGDLCDAGSCRRMIVAAGLQQIRSVAVTEHYSLEVYRRASQITEIQSLQ